MLLVNNQHVALDNDGYLMDLDDWSPAVAEALASSEEITLTPKHWEIIELLRQFYLQYQLSPANRALVKYLTQQLGADNINTLQLNVLFKGSPAKLAAKLAGLPRPTNCL